MHVICMYQVYIMVSSTFSRVGKDRVSLLSILPGVSYREFFSPVPVLA